MVRLRPFTPEPYPHPPPRLPQRPSLPQHHRDHSQPHLPLPRARILFTQGPAHRLRRRHDDAVEDRAVLAPGALLLGRGVHDGAQ